MLQAIPFDNLITRLIADSHDTRLWWQAGVLVLCALVAWGVRRPLRAWLDTSAYAQSSGIFVVDFHPAGLDLIVQGF